VKGKKWKEKLLLSRNSVDEKLMGDEAKTLKVRMIRGERTGKAESEYYIYVVFCLCHI